jgi:hypothetical protein
MNLNEFLNQGGDPIVYNIFGRVANSGKLSYTLQVLQAIDRGNNIASRRNFLLNATQGSLAPRKLTCLVNVGPNRINALMEACGLPAVTAEQISQIETTGESVNLFSAKETDQIIMLNDTGFFGAPVAIELTESPFQNPYTPNQTSVVNPATGEVKLYKAEEGIDPCEVYAHTELCPANLVQHQFIEDYFREPDARDYPEMVMEQLVKEKTTTIQSVNAEIDLTEQ